MRDLIRGIIKICLIPAFLILFILDIVRAIGSTNFFSEEDDAEEEKDMWSFKLMDW